jgi:hypothetical protein
MNHSVLCPYCGKAASIKNIRVIDMKWYKRFNTGTINHVCNKCGEIFSLEFETHVFKKGKQ